MRKPPTAKRYGPIPQYDAKRITVRLGEGHLATAKRLGDGDVSAGIRRALEWEATRAEKKIQDSAK